MRLSVMPLAALGTLMRPTLWGGIALVTVVLLRGAARAGESPPSAVAAASPLLPPRSARSVVAAAAGAAAASMRATASATRLQSGRVLLGAAVALLPPARLRLLCCCCGCDGLAPAGYDASAPAVAAMAVGSVLCWGRRQNLGEMAGCPNRAWARGLRCAGAKRPKRGIECPSYVREGGGGRKGVMPGNKPKYPHRQRQPGPNEQGNRKGADFAWPSPKRPRLSGHIDPATANRRMAVPKCMSSHKKRGGERGVRVRSQDRGHLRVSVARLLTRRWEQIFCVGKLGAPMVCRHDRFRDFDGAGGKKNTRKGRENCQLSHILSVVNQAISNQ